MLHIEPVKSKRSLPELFLSAVLLAAVLAIFLICVRAVSGRTEDEELSILENAIRRASVQCYAIEGRYPLPAWNIWRNTMESWWTLTNTPSSTTASHPT